VGTWQCPCPPAERIRRCSSLPPVGTGRVGDRDYRVPTTRPMAWSCSCRFIRRGSGAASAGRALAPKRRLSQPRQSEAASPLRVANTVLRPLHQREIPLTFLTHRRAQVLRPASVGPGLQPPPVELRQEDTAEQVQRPRRCNGGPARRVAGGRRCAPLGVDGLSPTVRFAEKGISDPNSCFSSVASLRECDPSHAPTKE
jgi:hypothetical protein